MCASLPPIYEKNQHLAPNKPRPARSVLRLQHFLMMPQVPKRTTTAMAVAHRQAIHLDPIRLRYPDPRQQATDQRLKCQNRKVDLTGKVVIDVQSCLGIYWYSHTYYASMAECCHLSETAFGLHTDNRAEGCCIQDPPSQGTYMHTDSECSHVIVRKYQRQKAVPR